MVAVRFARGVGYPVRTIKNIAFLKEKSSRFTRCLGGVFKCNITPALTIGFSNGGHMATF